MAQSRSTTIELRCLRVKQPIGDFYVAVIDASVLCQITEYDVRRIHDERPFETYLGIQRPLVPNRVKELQRYVRTVDACFPTSVILAIDGKYAEFVEEQSLLRLTTRSKADDEDSPLEAIARVLDGQHRIEGLREIPPGSFEVNVSVFVDIDIEDQAYIFSTVNLAQTKVNKSLVYDLFDLAKSRSPQKSAHNIAVALDKTPKSPFHKRIKRLGSATPGRQGETLTQATFIESLLPYISQDPAGDRDLYLRRKRPAMATEGQSHQLIFRNMFLNEQDLQITDVIWNYFDAVKGRWPGAWDATGLGMMLNKTNGFRALMQILRPAYLHLTAPGGVPDTREFGTLFARAKLQDDDFTVENFKPGTSGQALLYHTLRDQLGLANQTRLDI